MNNIKKECYKLLDEILKTNKLTQENMNKISDLFMFEDLQKPFRRQPVLILNINELCDYIVDWCDTERKNAIRNTLFMMNHAKHIDIHKDQYWFYIEGTNGELTLNTHSNIINYIKCCIEYNCFRCNLSDILFTLQSIVGESYHQKCLDIIYNKSNQVLNYREIYNFFTFLKKESNLVYHVYYVEYGLKESWKYPDITTSMNGLIDEMHKHCDYPEATEGFLTDLTINCCKNHVDADSGFIFWQDRNGYNYCENNTQITQHIIRWLKNIDFDLPNEYAMKLYKILQK